MFIEPRVGAAARPFGARVDFDGDGRADIAVSGGCSLDPGGIVTIYLGAAAATLAAPSMQIANPLGPTDVSFSTGLAYAGDVNGDGFGDLFVTAPFSGDGGHGYLYAGSPSGLGSVPSNMIDGVPTESIYIEAASIGDTDADGFGDIVVESNSSLMIIRGSSAGLRSIVDRRIANAPETIGHAIAGGYDLDSDGWPDIVVASRSSTSAAVRVYDGHDPTRLIATIPSPDVGDTGFGTSLAQGDVDGDGLADLMVGAPRYQSNSGRAYIFYNSPVPDFSTTRTLSASAMEGFAASLASSDVGGDGVDDIVIGAPSNRSVYLVHGRPDRVYSLGGTQIRPATSLQGFGTAVGASDVTGDGRSRMIVDAYYVGAGTLMEYSATSLSAPVATTTMSMPDCFGTRIVAH